MLGLGPTIVKRRRAQVAAAPLVLPREPVQNKTGALPKARPSWVVGQFVFNRSKCFRWHTILVSACEGCMLHRDRESSSRKLVWVQGQSFGGWGCSECAWVFKLPDQPTGKSLEEMKRKFEMQLSDEFASHHACAKSRVKGAICRA
jgi:hypothetical protein